MSDTDLARQLADQHGCAAEGCDGPPCAHLDMATGNVPPVDLDLDGSTLPAWIAYALDRKARIARLQAEYDRAVEVIQEALGDAPEGRVAGRPVVSWSWSKPSLYLDRKALEKDHPGIAAMYLREKKAARPFRLLDPEGDGQ